MLAHKVRHIVGEVVALHIKLVTDSTSAFAWAASGRCKSRSGQIANMILVWFQIVSQVSITEQDRRRFAGQAKRPPHQ